MRDRTPESVRRRFIAGVLTGLRRPRRSLLALGRGGDKSLLLDLYRPGHQFAVRYRQARESGIRYVAPVIDSGVSLSAWSSQRSFSAWLYTCNDSEESKPCRTAKYFRLLAQC